MRGVPGQIVDSLSLWPVIVGGLACQRSSERRNSDEPLPGILARPHSHTVRSSRAASMAWSFWSEALNFRFVKSPITATPVAP